MGEPSLLERVDVADVEEGLAGEASIRLSDLRDAADVVARVEVADAVTEALHIDGRGLREISRATGLDAAFLSRMANGRKGVTATSLALVALALGKSLKISIE
jgi:hypothetical protein